MYKRRDFIRAGLAAGGSGLLTSRAARAQGRDWLKYLCPPDDRARELNEQPPSPPAEPFVTELYSPPLMRPVERLDPPPDPKAHQRYEEFRPKRLFEIHETEFRWKFHRDEPYSRNGGSWAWGFNGASPGPTYRERYGTPVLVRRFNNLPTIGYGDDPSKYADNPDQQPYSRIYWALPSTTSHLHNGHTASESDGNPQDWIDSGEFWDHHYANFPLGFDPREKLTTLWYHDHRLDFTAANVYAGLFGFYLLYDPFDPDDPDHGDTGDERTGWRLPSRPQIEGYEDDYPYDIPLVLQDIRFRTDETGTAQAVFDNWNTDGMLGDRMTVNRIITPFLRVARRKYRFRILNGGPSRFYQLFLRGPRRGTIPENPNFLIITGDGNFLPQPVESRSIFLSVAQRVDVIMDFSAYQPGDKIYLHNLLKQTHGMGPDRGPDGPYLDFGDPVTNLMCFEVTDEKPEDNSRVPDFLRPLPTINMSEVKRHRTWDFDYDGGLWTINSRVMDPNRIDAGIDQGSAEIWTFRNAGNDWSHPIHSHFSEFLILEINGKPFRPTYIQDVHNETMALIDYLGRPPTERKPIKVYLGGPRRDVATLLPGDEIKLFMRWKDFLGKHVMHCHNVVHEDHAMMIRWDIMEPGKGFDGPRTVAQVYGDEPPPWPDPRPPALPHVEERPRNPNQVDAGKKENH